MTGELVDNCQHVSMTCCTNLADFCRRVGVSDRFRREESILLLSPEGRLSRLKAGVLPAPLHLTGSFLGAQYLTLGEKLRVAYGMARLRSAKRDRPGEPFSEWLLRNGQTRRTIDRFWSTVLVSALNERIDQTDVSHARKVFLDGFLRHRDGYCIELPLVPLGELYGTCLETWLAENGVSGRLTTGVHHVETDLEGSVASAVLRSGEAVAADFVVIAVPFDRVLGILTDNIVDRVPGLARLESLEASPITGIHLWFDRPVCPYDHVATIGRTIQWVFNHTAIHGRKPAESTEGQYLQLVVSASYDLLALDKAAILALALEELGAIWPAAREAYLLRSWVVTEHGATFAVRPGVDAHRPLQRTPIEGLFLAGDWTATGWPATMEGAVRSGYLAAEGVLEDLGRPTPLVQPDLKSGWLARWLIGHRTGASARDSSRRALPRTSHVTSRLGSKL